MAFTAVVTLVVPQTTDVNEPQLPLNTWIFAPDDVKLAPIEVRLTARLFENVDVVILYQTSSSGSPVAQPTGMPPVAVAPQTVPELLIVPLVSAVAPLQSSLDGGAG